MFIALRTMDPRELQTRRSRRRASRGEVRSALRYVRRTPELLVPLLMMALVGTISFNFQVLLPLLADFTWHGTATTYALLTAAMGVGSVGGALAAGARGRVSPKLLVGSSLLFGAAELLAAIAPTLPLPTATGGGRDYACPRGGGLEGGIPAHGSDRPKVDRALRRLRDRFGEEAVERLSAQDISGEDAVAACNAMGLFGGGAGWCSSTSRALEGARREGDRRDPGLACARHVLALVGEEIRKDSPLVKACGKAGEVLVYEVSKRSCPSGWRSSSPGTG